MTLRDQFAATCAAGLLACYAKNNYQVFPYSDEIARRAYQFADALLRERGDEAHGAATAATPVRPKQPRKSRRK
jgi:hypothetical protein